MSNRQLRKIIRLIHVIGGALIATCIYAPWGRDPLLLTIVRFVVLPLLVLTGLALWQQARLAKLLKGNVYTDVRA